MKAYLLRYIADTAYRFTRIFYRFRKSNFYCEQLWLRVSILQDGRIEPCNCAISQMEPQRPASSIHEAWNHSIFRQTRRHLTGKIAGGGDIPSARRDIFDCCASCPVAPYQRFDWKFLKEMMRRCAYRRANNNTWLMLKKLNNYRKLVTQANTGASTIDAYPIFANIDPANLCNLRCPECLVGNGEITHARGFMSLTAYENLMREIGPHLFYLELYRYGEPLLNKDIVQMIELAAKQYGIVSRISTNFAMPLSEEFLRGLVGSGLSHIIIAADDIQQDLYEKYRRGGEVSRVIENLKTLVRIKKETRSPTPHIRWQMLVFNFNEHRKQEIERFVRDLGVDDVDFAPAYLSPKNYHLLPESDRARGRKAERKAQIVHAKATPEAIGLGEPFTLEVEVLQNVFKEPIPVSPKDGGIRVGVKLAGENKEEMEEPGFTERLLFEKPLAPGERVTLARKLTLPETVDRDSVRFLKIDLVMEHKFWFEQNMEIQSRPYFLPVELKKQSAAEC
ncbi:MAG: radical SAM protein [Nitrospinales bacterium]